MADVVTSNLITLSGDGAIPTPGDLRPVYILVTKGSAAALTIAAPVTLVDDGKTIEIFFSTNYAHVITGPASCFKWGGSDKHIATLITPYIRGWLSLVAINGVWFPRQNSLEAQGCIAWS